ncbi:ABC transporter substrate-binding protein [Streptomyces sp. JJ66]|uniref:ABC transporter substrate-binding protein n=1 Tax=Streptomyces sp. JJ66 TaxID=2803843 RepID=UPI001C56C160|nr:ABC transporter substrate-binding protein [Streptomyces sp. JJ66]MBW1600770.1 ABC transporter substrate-binding protein [Streptomyces sp. JJ66]
MYDGTTRPSAALPAPTPRARHLRGAALALATALTTTVLAGCGDGTRDSAEERPAQATAEGFPVTIDNCGVTTTYEEPPSRAVTIHQHPAELMLALGLEDRMIGTAFPDSAVLPEHQEAYEAIPELAEKEPSFESILEAEPDFVYGGYGSAFAEDAGRSRDAFADAGIDTHLNREYCGEGEVSMEDAYDEIRTLGTIFGVQERAEEVVADLEHRISETTGAVEEAPKVPVFVYDSGDKSAFTAGGQGLGTEIIHLAGGRNVFADLDEVFGDVSWEQVIARKPEVIALYDYRGAGSVAEKKEVLLSQPALADVPAVKNERFVVLPLTATLVGVRPPHAVEDLARGLHPERFR